MEQINKEKFEQVLLGSLLGDGSIYKHSNKNGTCGYYYNEKHSTKQQEYALWKINVLNPLLGIYYWYKQYQDKRTNNTYYSIYCKSRISLMLEEYYNLFYSNNKKRVSTNLLNRLRPLGIAIWFMDDGSYDYRTNNIDIATNGFTFEENQLIHNWFNNLWDINFVIQDYKNQYRLRTNNIDTRKFINLIRPYIHDCMNYKIGLDLQKFNIAKQRIKFYRETNKDIIKERRKKQRETLHYKERIKEYYYKNREHLLKKHKEWWDNNKEKMKGYTIKYFNKNPDKIRASWRKYYYVHKDEINEKKREKRKIKSNLERLK